MAGRRSFTRARPGGCTSERAADLVPTQPQVPVPAPAPAERKPRFSFPHPFPRKGVRRDAFARCAPSLFRFPLRDSPRFRSSSIQDAFPKAKPAHRGRFGVIPPAVMHRPTGEAAWSCPRKGPGKRRAAGCAACRPLTDSRRRFESEPRPSTPIFFRPMAGFQESCFANLTKFG